MAVSKSNDLSAAILCVERDIVTVKAMSEDKIRYGYEKNTLVTKETRLLYALKELKSIHDGKTDITKGSMFFSCVTPEVINKIRFKLNFNMELTEYERSELRKEVFSDVEKGIESKGKLLRDYINNCQEYFDEKSRLEELKKKLDKQNQKYYSLNSWFSGWKDTGKKIEELKKEISETESNIKKNKDYFQGNPFSNLSWFNGNIKESNEILIKIMEKEENIDKINKEILDLSREVDDLKVFSGDGVIEYEKIGEKEKLIERNNIELKFLNEAMDELRINFDRLINFPKMLFSDPDDPNVSGGLFRDNYAKIEISDSDTTLKGYNFDPCMWFAQELAREIPEADKKLYSSAYEEGVEELSGKMKLKAEKTFGYRIEENDDGRPHISQAKFELFIESLEKKTVDGKTKYFINFEPYGKKEINIDLEEGKYYAFKDTFTQEIYKKIIKEDKYGFKDKKIHEILEEDNKEISEKLKQELEILTNNIDISMLNCKVIARSGMLASDIDNICNLEVGTLSKISLKLKEKGYLVSNEYIRTWILNNKINDSFRDRVKKFDESFRNYLDNKGSKPAYTFVKDVFPGSLIEEINSEEEAKDFIKKITNVKSRSELFSDLLKKGSDNKELSKYFEIVSGFISNILLSRAEEQIKNYDGTNELFGISSKTIIEITIEYYLYKDKELSIPKGYTEGCDPGHVEELNNKFVRKLKKIYEKVLEEKKGEILKLAKEKYNENKIEKGKVKEVSNFKEWAEELTSAINDFCQGGNLFNDEVSKSLTEQIRLDLLDDFIKRCKVELPDNLDYSEIKKIQELKDEKIKSILESGGVDEKHDAYKTLKKTLETRFNNLIFEKECAQLEESINFALKTLGDLQVELAGRTWIEFGTEFLGGAVKATAVAGVAASAGLFMTSGGLVAIGGAAGLLSSVLGIVAGISPLAAIAVVAVLCKLVLPVIIDNLGYKNKKQFNACKDAILFSITMAIMPLIGPVNEIKKLLSLKTNIEKKEIIKLFISLASLTAGIMVFAYFPAIMSVLSAGSAMLPAVTVDAATGMLFSLASKYKPGVNMISPMSVASTVGSPILSGAGFVSSIFSKFSGAMAVSYLTSLALCGLFGVSFSEEAAKEDFENRILKLLKIDEIGDIDKESFKKFSDFIKTSGPEDFLAKLEELFSSVEGKERDEQLKICINHLEKKALECFKALKLKEDDTYFDSITNVIDGLKKFRESVNVNLKGVKGVKEGSDISADHDAVEGSLEKIKRLAASAKGHKPPKS
jgi:hypothetical protein